MATTTPKSIQFYGVRTYSPNKASVVVVIVWFDAFAWLTGTHTHTRVSLLASGNKYGEFSNFWHAPIWLKSRKWPTTEHYFQV